MVFFSRELADQQAGNRFGVKVCEEGFEILLRMQTKLLFGGVDQRPDDADEIHTEKAPQFISSHTVVSAAQQMPVMLHIVHNEQNRLTAVHQQIELADDFNGLLLQHPFQQRINILEVIIKGLAVHAAVGNDLADRDFGKRLFLHKALQGSRKHLLCIQRCNFVFHMLNTTDKITQDGDKITFSSDADKAYYQGTLKEKNLPWNISIRYFLDGKETSAEEIAGKSGALEIRFSVSKNERCKGSFYEDYALQASFTLDTEKCGNIRASGATAANVGSKKQLTYTILPGKGIDTVIQADVTDFEMDAVSINGVRLNLNFEIDDAALTEKVNEIVSAIGTVNDGAANVNSGAGKLADATGTLSSGLSEIKAKNSQLTGAAYTAYEGLCTAAATALNSQLTAKIICFPPYVFIHRIENII